MSDDNLAPESQEEEPQFEKLLARLEAIVAEMESGQLSLEKCLARFEEGSKLAAACGKRLTEVEKRVELLLKCNNQVETRDFE